MNEQRRIALGLRPRTVRGWLFWLRYWSPIASWLQASALPHTTRSVQAGFVRCRVCGETKRIETGIVCAECDASATKEGHPDAE